MKHCLTFIKNYKIDKNVISFIAPEGTLELKVLSNDVFSVSYNFSSIEIKEDLKNASTSMTDSCLLKGSNFDFEDKGKSFSITFPNSTTHVVIEKAHAQIAIFKNGKLIHGGALGNSDTVIPSYQTRVISNGSSIKGHFNFPLEEKDEFYGLGDKTGLSNRRGRKFAMFNRDSLAYDATSSDPLYKSMPFLIKTNSQRNEAIGLLFPQTLIDEINLGKESPFYFSIKVDGGPFAYFVICKDSYKDIVQAYYDLTGYPELPPLFSFGFFGSSMNYVESYDAAQRILNYFSTVEEKNIPCEGMYVSSGYLKADDGKRYSFLWNQKKFPKYGEYLDALSKRGYNLCMNIKPGILTTHPWYEELAKKGFFIQTKNKEPYVEYFWGGEASFIDFSNPEAKEWWKKELKSQYLDHGCTGIWNDNNELELEDSEVEAFDTKALYPVRMCQAAYEAFKEKQSNIRPWIYSRSGYIGISRFARTWSGDNTSTFESLKYNQYMGIGMSLSGLSFFGHDIGGFAGPRPSEELLVRASETAIFQGRFVIHSWREDDKPTEPWTYPNSEHIIKSLIDQHYHFLPYIYTQAFETATTGYPIERALHLEFPEDKAIKEDEVNCLFGSSILKINITEPGIKTQKVHLPLGADWVNPKTMEIMSGGHDVEYDASITGKAHWFGKAGSVIPVSQDSVLKAIETLKAVDLIVLPSRSKKTVVSHFFWDDGLTALNLNQYSYIEIANNSENLKIEVKELKAPMPKSIRLVFSNGQKIELTSLLKTNNEVTIPILKGN